MSLISIDCEFPVHKKCREHVTSKCEVSVILSATGSSKERNSMDT